jgi:hypothetical protein
LIKTRVAQFIGGGHCPASRAVDHDDDCWKKVSRRQDVIDSILESAVCDAIRRNRNDSLNEISMCALVSEKVKGSLI